MPKGVGRPQNRKVKKAVQQGKNRMSAFSAFINGGASPETAERKVLKSPAAKKDQATRANSMTRARNRVIGKNVGRKTLGQTKAATQRERIKRK